MAKAAAITIVRARFRLITLLPLSRLHAPHSGFGLQKNPENLENPANLENLELS
jgi:hypothetical protein